MYEYNTSISRVFFCEKDDIELNKLNPEKLTVQWRNGVTVTEPIIGRRYTLTHSDETGDLFLTIGKKYAYEKITEMRDEVLAEWRQLNGNPYLFVYVYVGNYGPKQTAIRNTIFRRELPLALEAIMYGDKEFFYVYQTLQQAPIYIHFESPLEAYHTVEVWGMVKNYM